MAAQTVVELEKCPCTSGQASRNKTVLANALRANTIVQLPEGIFNSDSVTISGIENLTIRGAGQDGTITTKIVMAGSTGMAVSGSPNMRMENLEIRGADANANLVVLSDAGDLAADNLLLTTGSGTYNECLQPNLDWLVPVISLILN